MAEKTKLKFGKETIKGKTILVGKPKRVSGVGTAGDSVKFKVTLEKWF